MEPPPTEPEELAELRQETEDQVSKLPKDLKSVARPTTISSFATINNPSTTPEDRATHTRTMQAFNETLKRSQDPKVSRRDRVAYERIAMNMVKVQAIILHPDTEQEKREFCMKELEFISNELLTVQDPETRPKKSKDREEIQKVVDENSKALATVADPNASPNEQNEAQAKLDRLPDSLENPQYLELTKEIKRYQVPEACVNIVGYRTRQAGWPSGSLWGLSDPSCAATVAEGARDSSSQWSALFECVKQSIECRNPFATCAVHIPKD
ncbi:hypothetical protein [Streptomyces cadmiisoli]|uniref:hypothetical protein n=1 Tax=Streptomyces cadmiisoli TaxID=2184053 RepID=UPI0018EF53F4|nr:hypothetical protein [Streptomyces cadmiisoli]